MQIQMVRAGVYFSSVLDERPEHKADYVPYQTPGRNVKQPRILWELTRFHSGAYVGPAGGECGLKSRIIRKI